MEVDFQSLKVQGVKINYYYVCKRKLWFFDKGISMENNSERVLQGKLLHEYSYPRLKIKEVLIDNTFKVDIMSDDYIREIKISSKMAHVDKMQIAYYLYYLKKLGMKKKGIINYTKEKKKEEVELTPELEKEIERALKDIKKITSSDSPPKFKKLPYCKKCAYYGLCFAKEDD
ncbi:CRISPR-associated protein Cas4 [Caminicella sporogenes]|uniref:CRISPR-associated protein Cas4 n=1 Tax=Caminicella sporogenes TaxID=166485 RepID=UPI00253F85DD|nr:CRISPR-associated protein Cas4 [Caminicella sporogenes]WIF95344.1 CRISPR-associated protein Cas4 [Caminicella sporogenes]